LQALGFKVTDYLTAFSTLYHFDPSNPPTTSNRYNGSSRKKMGKTIHSKSNNSRDSFNDTTSTNTSEELNQFVTNNKHNHSVTSNVDNQTDDNPKMTVIEDNLSAKEIVDCEIEGENSLGMESFTKELQLAASQNDLQSQVSHLSLNEELSPNQKNQSTSPNLPVNDSTIDEEEEVSSLIIDLDCCLNSAFIFLGICDAHIEHAADSRGLAHC